MKIQPIKTDKLTSNCDITTILDASCAHLQENSVIVVTSKIVSICEGSVVADNGSTTKSQLAKIAADKYFSNDQTARYDTTLTIKYNTLIANAGIDHSNGNGSFVLWPKDPMRSAQEIWSYLREHDTIQNLGVIITDSHLIPLRWGTVGFGLAWCGFEALNSYIGKPDLFGKPLKITNLSVLDGLAGAAVVVMGEGSEQTPIAVIEDVPFVHFKNRPPSESEIQSLKIDLKDDMYAPLLTAVKWEKPSSK